MSFYLTSRPGQGPSAGGFSRVHLIIYIDGKNPSAYHLLAPQTTPFLRLSRKITHSPCAKLFLECCNKQTTLPSLVPKTENSTGEREDAFTQQQRQSAATAVAIAFDEHEVSVTQPAEFSRIFEAHHGMIFRTAYRITGNAADAEDVLQTIFLRLLRQPAGAVILTQEESYLRRAAVNASLDILRQRQSAASVPLNEAAAPDPSTPADSSLKDCLRRALKTLSERSAEIFAFRFFEDMSNQQIASALNISQVLVAVSLHRSRRQLQKEIRTCLGGSQ